MSSPDPLHSHLTSETFSSHLSSLKQIHVTLTEAHSESQEKIKTLESALAKSEREIASLKNEVRRLEEKRRTAMETLGKEEMTGNNQILYTHEVERIKAAFCGDQIFLFTPDVRQKWNASAMWIYNVDRLT